MPRTEVVVDTRRLSAIIRNSGANAQTALRNVAFTVERLAKQRAPVDTGALRASIYTVIGPGMNQPPHVTTEARRAPIPTPTDRLVAHVGPSVEYGLFQELGTRTTAAQPYLLPAVRQAAQIVPSEFRRVATDE